jgi:hypothetical protein
MEPVYPDHITPDLRDLLQLMLHKDPMQRIDITGISVHQWLRMNRSSLLLRRDLTEVRDLRRVPVSVGDIDHVILEVMRRKGISGELVFEDFVRGETEQVLVYKILKTISVQKVLPVFCQSVLLKAQMAPGRVAKSRSADLGTFGPVTRNTLNDPPGEPEGSPLVEKPLPPLTIISPAPLRPRQGQVVKPVLHRRPTLLRDHVHHASTPEPRFLAPGTLSARS